MAIQDFTAGQVLTAAQMDTLQANDYNWTVSTKTASYVLVAADKGTRIVMNSASATTVTVNTSLFSAGDTLQIINIGAGTCTVTAGTATVTTSGSLALAQWGGGTLYFTSASASIFFPYGGVSYGTATGGTSSSISDGGLNYTLLSFTTDGTLTVSRAGLFDCLVIGGGGSGGGGGFGCGGGGAGNYIRATVYLAAASYAVTVGAGGAGNGGAGNAGSISKLAVDPKLWAYGGSPGKEQNYGALDGDGGISGTPDSYVGGQGVVAANGEAGGGGGGGGSGGNGGSGAAGIVLVRFQV
jgi:hypothetical protein